MGPSGYGSGWAPEHAGRDSCRKVGGGLDFYHASQYLSETIATRDLPKAQRQRYTSACGMRCGTRPMGLRVQEALRALVTTRRSKAIYGGPCTSHAVCDAEAQAPIGSGQLRARRRSSAL
jgi:hypothetical protein